MEPRGTAAAAAAVTLCLVLAPGCVKRVQEAPGLVPGGPMSVEVDMRVETFTVGEYEVRAFRIPLSDTNRRRYQFHALKNGIQERSYSVEVLEDATWLLTEERPDGITVTHMTWQSEPSYAAARRVVQRQLGGPAGH